MGKTCDAIGGFSRRPPLLSSTTMRALLALLLVILAVPACAQAPAFNPAADYITPGQDEPGYRAWVTADPTRTVYVRAFNNYLVTYGVGGVVPTWQLLRTATDWSKCGAQPFEVPPTAAWPNIVAALRYVGAFVEPRVGEVEVVSVYRNPALNACAQGAPTSTHLTMGAIDMVPLSPTTRESLMTRLCALHLASGERFWIGLGLYKGLRFHIDARKYREWGMEGAQGHFGCVAVLAEGPMPYVEPISPPPTGSQQ
jgi:hypothetical protein